MRRYQIFSLLKSLTLKWKVIAFKKSYNAEKQRHNKEKEENWRLKNL